MRGCWRAAGGGLDGRIDNQQTGDTVHAEDCALDLYASVVFIHATTILLFFIAHGTSMAVAFKLKQESDPARVRALLELSKFTMGVPTTIVFIIGLLTGIIAGFLGSWWGSLWIWTSLVLLVLVAGLMTPLATMRLARIGTAAGLPPKEGPPAEDPGEMLRLIRAWNPLPIAAMGMVAFIVILWLMLSKPF